jgi:predicted Fe-Mo cluster-binding NifX family protein
MLQSAGIDLILGISGGNPRRLVESYLKGELVSQSSSCEGHHLHLCNGHGR